MGTRQRALRWLGARRMPGSHVVTSKRYQPEESWTKAKAWWLQVPLTAIHAGKTVELVCEADQASDEFHLLRVPAAYFVQNLGKFALIGEDKVNLFLAIESGSEFQDQRGPGRVSFAQFEIRPPAA